MPSSDTILGSITLAGMVALVITLFFGDDITDWCERSWARWAGD